jgi:signal peptidase I
MNKNKIKKIVSYAFTGLCVILVFLTSLEVISATKDSRPPAIFGYSISYVPTESMEPEIEAGEYIYYKKTTFDDVGVEDVIIYKSKSGQMKGKYIVHRIVEKHDDYLIVKGDNNLINDSEHVTSDMIYGKYIDKVEILNFITRGLSVNALFFILMVLFMVLLVLQFIAVFAKTKKEEIEKKLEEDKQILLEQMKQEILKEELEKLRNSKKME